MNRIPVGDSPNCHGVGDALSVVKLHDGIEACQTGSDHLRAAAESGEEVRFNEPGRDPHVSRQPRPVQPNGNTTRRFAHVLQHFGVEGAVVHDAVAARDVGAEHLVQLFRCVWAMGAGRDHDSHLIVRNVCQLSQEHGQYGPRRHGASNVANGDSDRLSGLDQSPETRAAAQGISERVANGALLVGQTRNVRRLDDSSDVVGEFDFEAGASVGEGYQHRYTLSSSWQNSTHWTSSEITTYSRSVCIL